MHLIYQIYLYIYLLLIYVHQTTHITSSLVCIRDDLR